jgi:hypothetical protein
MSEAIGLRLHADHLMRVQLHMNKIINNLLSRLVCHDSSKYNTEEISLIIGKAMLNNTTYGSAEYNIALKSVQDGVLSHYSKNTHHPEHYVNGIVGMSLFDLLEMLADWKSAGEQNGGDILSSLTINIDRYNIPEPIAKIISNTIQELNW